MSRKKPTASIEETLKVILFSNKVSTQDEIKQALDELGFNVNQSKISRLLRKLGAIKITNEYNQIIYTLPREPAPPTSQNIVSQLVLNMTMNESVIVIHTNPGSASLIGRLLDHNRSDLNILGTVAGDDTIFVAPNSTKYIKKILKKLNTFFVEIR